MKLTAQDVSDGKVSLARTDGAKKFTYCAGSDTYQSTDGAVTLPHALAGRAIASGAYQVFVPAKTPARKKTKKVKVSNEQ